MPDDINEKLGRILATQENQTKQLDNLVQEVSEQRKILTENTIVVAEHHKRSTMLEKELFKMDDDLSKVKEHIIRVEGFGKGIRWLGYIAAAGTAIIGFLAAIGKL